ncbi:hypothetical protein SISNIDRAFT_447557 [Sistotremastrum niveocremeum HHB9708]|uniref:MYND-type domain-containing protein n=1 Tax=Sistotremastrum niveocremeum HHB9708 TaxID=1314777 RepID=A0A165AC14_9AGAM|nr:hypothetical protein SISNIDRAFT_447557 [Sistotremastrum niveocremeum HHB9708]
MARTCVVCATPTRKTCTGCLKTAYCSKKCQRADWRLHIVYCDDPGREVTAADDLAADIFANRVPELPTIQMYGMSKIKGIKDYNYLVAIYTDAFQFFSISPRTLNQERNTVSQRNWSWLREHASVFDRRGQMESLDGSAVVIQDVYQLLVWKHIGGSPFDTVADIVRAQKSWPLDKRACFEFVSVVISCGGPNVYLAESWQRFGYCVSKDEEDPLPRRLYHELIERCTFDEFYDAYRSCSLIALMDAKGLRSIRKELPREFKIILSQSAHHVATVWGLKALVLSDYYVEPIPCVSISYGFSNCQGSEESKRLRQFYARLFQEYDVEPLKLERASNNDRIYEYIIKLPKVIFSNTEKRFFKRVMKRNNLVFSGFPGMMDMPSPFAQQGY